MGHLSLHPKTLDSPNELLQVIEASEGVKQKPRKWYYYLWDTLDKPKEERWFMFKLDAALLTFASLGTVQSTFQHNLHLPMSRITLSNI
jgi:ACS family pantothenate transporter-like MFS transporter